MSSVCMVMLPFFNTSMTKDPCSVMRRIDIAKSITDKAAFATRD